ncbi:hypothetical protein [Thermococcus sp. JCM 11816]|uniref:hypothetical protein n=1 Tax=Thermococcus sp. (strain JCM 11816 / KS-1) TaxID=1295125 RepID=UPI000A779C9A
MVGYYEGNRAFHNWEGLWDYAGIEAPPLSLSVTSSILPPRSTVLWGGRWMVSA